MVGFGVKIAWVAAAVLLVACSAQPDLRPKATLPDSAAPVGLMRSPKAEAVQTAQARVTATTGRDALSLRVVIGQPEFKTQRLELSRIRRLRAWVTGPGISSPIMNLNDYVAINPTQGQATQLQIQDVPRGRQRIVTVQGYDVDGQNFPAVPAATLKAVYNSPANTGDVTLNFTWRSTAEAEVIEALQAQIPNNPAIAALVDQLDRGALNALLDKLIFANNSPQGNTYFTHPERLNPAGIAAAIIAGDGRMPAYTSGAPVPAGWLDPLPDVTLVVRSPQQSGFVNSNVLVQITDPASTTITLNHANDTAQFAGIVPGTWDALVRIDAPNGGVTAKAQVVVSDTGTVTLVEGSSQTPFVLPPVIQSLSATQGGAGTKLTITGDGFNADPNANTVLIGNVPATISAASATSLTVTVPASLANGSYPVTVKSNGKTSNYIDFAVQPAVTLIRVPTGAPVSGGVPGSQIVMLVAGFDPSQQTPVVTFSGSNGPVTAPLVSTGSIAVVVNVPNNPALINGPITLTLPNGTVIQTPPFTVTGPRIDAAYDSNDFTLPIVADHSVDLWGAGFSGATGLSLNAQPLSYTVLSDEQITFDLPAGSSPGQLVLTTPAGPATFALKVQNLPQIGALTPPARAGDPYTLTGSNFQAIDQIQLGNQVLPPSSYQILNDNTLKLLTIPDEPVLPPLRISNSAGTALFSLSYSGVVNVIGDSSIAPAAINYTDFCVPHGVDVDKLGNLYITDAGCVTGAGAILKVAPDGTLTKMGNNRVPSAFPVDGDNFLGTFNGPEDLTHDADNNIYVADTTHSAIRKITPDGKIRTLARLPGPEGLEIGPDGKLYVSANFPPNSSAERAYLMRIDDLNTFPTHDEIMTFNPISAAVAEATRTSNVTIVAGGPTTCLPSPYNIPAPTTVANTHFCHVEGMGMDGEGNVYMADVENYQIRKMNLAAGPTGLSTVIAKVYHDPAFTNAPWTVMHEIEVDRFGNVYFLGGSPAPGVYRVAPDGTIELVAGQIGQFGHAEGRPLTEASFNDSRGIDIGPDGALYVVDSGLGVGYGVRKIARFIPNNAQQMP